MRLSAGLLLLLLGTGEPTRAQSAPEILLANCGACHGAAKMSSLDLRTRETALKGGTRGPALVPGSASGSLLFKAVSGADAALKMPPGKLALKPAEVEIIRQWIDGGAPFSSTTLPEPSWWSFKPPKRPAVPQDNSGWSTNEVDRFLLAGWNKRGLKPNRQASKLALLRRATFDLHGLPPTQAQMDAFIKDDSPGAWAKVVDELLASPRYGERWGRHWLDVVRYADTGGYETDIWYNNAWRYRDYVIESFNRDKPYDEFVKEQIAADEIWPGDFELEGAYELPKHKQELLHKRLGTSLYTVGPMAVEFTFFAEQYRSEWEAEAVETTGSAFLGLTLGCARCHDHKFDPLSQKEFYKMAACFTGSEDREVPIVSRMHVYEFTRHQAKHRLAEELKAKLQRLDAGVRKRKGIVASGDDREEPALPYSAAEKDQRETLLRQLGEAYLAAPKPYAAANLLAHADRVPATHVLTRGDYKQPGERVRPGFPAALNPAAEIVEPDSELFVPQRRKALAEWITAKDQPLLARVMVNRIWQGHFGEGIVPTPNDFGRQGEPPSHPELLDWLAVEFADRGYSIKQMHRLMLVSSAYRMSSEPNADNAKIDPSNRHFWRMNRRRLEAESIRDAMLASSGQLNLKAGGPPVVVPLTREERTGMRDFSQWPVSQDDADHSRRSVYLLVKRSFRLPMLETFDAPDPAASCARRESSTVATQALTLLNSGFSMAQAKAMAGRLEKLNGADRARQVESAFRLALSRSPSENERGKAEEFVGRNGLERFCLLLFNLNEFVYVD